MIPSVKDWRIVFKKNGVKIATYKISAPNKNLAWLNLVDAYPMVIEWKWKADQITCSKI